MQNTDTTKYIIHSKINADGVIERPDIVGAIFGQTEGLLGADLDLRDLQKTGRIGRIEVMVTAKGGKTKGNIFVPSSLDKVETSILAASLETIDRVGPCSAKIEVFQVEDVRAVKRKKIIERAKLIFTKMFDETVPESQELADEVRQSVRVDELTHYGKSRIPCGPNVLNSDAIIIVEGRADILNLLRYGIKNTICVGGTNIPPEVAELTKKKTVTAFTDGDRGGELIIRELLQVADLDYVARAPDGKCVEDLVQKEIIRSLRRKVPVEQIIEKYGIQEKESGDSACRLERVSKRKMRAPEVVPRIAEKKLHKRVKVHRVSPKTEAYEEESPEEIEEAVPEKSPEKAHEKVSERSLEKTPEAAEKVEARKAVSKPPVMARPVPAARAPRGKPSAERVSAVKVPGGEAVRVSPAPSRQTPVAPVSPEAARFRPHVDALKGTLTARILDSEDKVIEEIAVRDLASRLKTYRDNVKSVVFDGVITQRLVDIASSNAIKNLIGVKIGNIAKVPTDMEVLTSAML
ncbi:DNA primase [Methanosarcina siciliae C2J]|uniref:DNA primase DnaG n=3 Tax=Methanosarcina siciliae TaxID=38027 RepID=A0A0E3L9R2_9EURY|nr:DNA primase DnaG [Methanosarcina siciliae]AKB26745.1 DNA primase [Methanosarcina siciliae T4/M]AKB30716.1 DNA primase [Methanosarcina siciliae HI350]AKB34619.1 DNA primase [Methanosarcina siciliae C2J]